MLREMKSWTFQQNSKFHIKNKANEPGALLLTLVKENEFCYFETRSHYVALVGLELTVELFLNSNRSTSVSPVLGLKVCAIMPGKVKVNC